MSPDTRRRFPSNNGVFIAGCYGWQALKIDTKNNLAGEIVKSAILAILSGL
jgi:hypothetical protein